VSKKNRRLALVPALALFAWSLSRSFLHVKWCRNQPVWCLKPLG
jgi:hypothetical protein